MMIVMITEKHKLGGKCSFLSRVNKGPSKRASHNDTGFEQQNVVFGNCNFGMGVFGMMDLIFRVVDLVFGMVDLILKKDGFCICKDRVDQDGENGICNDGFELQHRGFGICKGWNWYLGGWM